MRHTAWCRPSLVALMVLVVALVSTGCGRKPIDNPNAALLAAFEEQEKRIGGLAEREYVKAYVIFATVEDIVEIETGKYQGTAEVAVPYYEWVIEVVEIETIEGKPPIRPDGKMAFLVRDVKAEFNSAGFGEEAAKGQRFKFTVLERRTFEGEAKDRVFIIQPVI